MRADFGSMSDTYLVEQRNFGASKGAAATVAVVEDLLRKLNEERRRSAGLREALSELLEASLTETTLRESAGRRAAARDAARAALAEVGR